MLGHFCAKQLPGTLYVDTTISMGRPIQLSDLESELVTEGCILSLIQDMAILVIINIPRNRVHMRSQ